MQNTVRLVLFGVLFTVGATVVCVVALADDLVQYYGTRQQLVAAQRMVELLEKLNADYEALLDQVRQDPNLIKRIAPATLGTQPQEPNTAHPTVRLEELMAARQTLFVADPASEEPPPLPLWLARCTQSGPRWGLFLSGAGLVVVAFVFFGPQRSSPSPTTGGPSAAGAQPSADSQTDAPQDGPVIGSPEPDEEKPQR